MCRTELAFGGGRKYFCSDGCHMASRMFESSLHEYRPIKITESPVPAQPKPHGDKSKSEEENKARVRFEAEEAAAALSSLKLVEKERVYIPP